MTTAPRVLIYGANGYTGLLVAAEALERGLRPVLSGRSEHPVREVADRLGLEARPFDLTVQRAAARHLEDVDVVLHCAGPFAATYESMVRACLATGTHYLDVTGEMEVLDGVYGHHDEARAAGIALVPGVGFDVVPTDHLVARLVDEVPDACGADVAVISRGGFSRGTLRTAADGVGTGNRIRRVALP